MADVPGAVLVVQVASCASTLVRKPSAEESCCPGIPLSQTFPGAERRIIETAEDGNRHSARLYRFKSERIDDLLDGDALDFRL